MLNKVMLIGNVGTEPEFKATAAGTPLVSLSLATNEKWTDKSGNKQEKTEWHRCTAFGRTAELIGQYVHKGSKVYVEGKITTNQYVVSVLVSQKRFGDQRVLVFLYLIVKFL